MFFIDPNLKEVQFGEELTSIETADNVPFTGFNDKLLSVSMEDITPVIDIAKELDPMTLVAFSCLFIIYKTVPKPKQKEGKDE